MLTLQRVDVEFILSSVYRLFNTRTRFVLIAHLWRFHSIHEENGNSDYSIFYRERIIRMDDKCFPQQSRIWRTLELGTGTPKLATFLRGVWRGIIWARRTIFPLHGLDRQRRSIHSCTIDVFGRRASHSEG